MNLSRSFFRLGPYHKNVFSEMPPSMWLGSAGVRLSRI